MVSKESVRENKHDCSPCDRRTYLCCFFRSLSRIACLLPVPVEAVLVLESTAVDASGIFSGTNSLPRSAECVSEWVCVVLERTLLRALSGSACGCALAQRVESGVGVRDR